MAEDSQGREIVARAVAGVLMLIVPAAAIAAIALALGLGERQPLDVLGSGIAAEAGASAEPERDPYSWHPSRREDFERRAALGASHVIYEMSPGGVIASAKRTANFREEVEAAAGRHELDPNLLEAIVFLESAGRSQVMAGPTPEAASGLAQIIPSTATDLLGMSVDLPASIELTERIQRTRDPEKAELLVAERAEIDERFDPEKALEGAATYIEIARERFGAEDLAIASYHMGIGNLENVIRAFLDAPAEPPIGELVAAEDLSFAQLYFDSSPSDRAKAYKLLSGFGDESSEYLWKVRASAEIMDRFRGDPDALADTAELATAKATLEEVFHPENETEVFEDADAVDEARTSGELVELPSEPALGWIPGPDVGELAGELDQEPELYRALRPEALATLGYMAALVARESEAERPLEVTSAVRDREYQELLTASNPEATHEYSLHTTGWAFDIRRKYESGRQAEAFQFVLDRLRALALIDYAVEPGAIHVTASGEADALLTLTPSP